MMCSGQPTPVRLSVPAAPPRWVTARPLRHLPQLGSPSATDGAVADLKRMPPAPLEVSGCVPAGASAVDTREMAADVARDAGC